MELITGYHLALIWKIIERNNAETISIAKNELTHYPEICV